MKKLILILSILITLCVCSCANDIVSWNNSKSENEKALAMMDSVKQNLHTTADVEKLLKLYRYRDNSFIWNYTPTIETVFREHLAGNCQFSAVLGEWALECIGIPARGVTIYRGMNFHAIAVSKDNTIFISNNDLVRILGDGYKTTILAWFDPDYEHWHEGILRRVP